MKIILLAVAACMASGAMAQMSTLASGIFDMNSKSAAGSGGHAGIQALNGSTLDLEQLKAHASTLAPGKTNHPPHAVAEYEEVIIVKEGSLTITIKDTTKTLGPGGIVLIMPGDEQSFTNTSGQPVMYYVLQFRSKSPVNLTRAQEAGGTFIADWKDIAAKTTDKGESRPIVNRPTGMFSKLDIHATTLNETFPSHAPHTHRAEEIMLLMKGEVTMQLEQSFYKAAAGDLIFVHSNVLHALKNTGSGQCTYFAIQWNN